MLYCQPWSRFPYRKCAKVLTNIRCHAICEVQSTECILVQPSTISSQFKDQRIKISLIEFISKPSSLSIPDILLLVSY